MTTKTLLIFTVIVTFITLAATGIAWTYFVKWYKDEEKAKRNKREQ